VTKITALHWNCRGKNYEDVLKDAAHISQRYYRTCKRDSSIRAMSKHPLVNESMLPLAIHIIMEAAAAESILDWDGEEEMRRRDWRGVKRCGGGGDDDEDDDDDNNNNHDTNKKCKDEHGRD